MADKKISELDAITGAATAADDFFIVVDTSGSATKKISRAELNNAIEQDVLAQVDITSANIDGGTIDNTPIGATTPSTGDFTTVDTTGDVTVGGTITSDGLTVEDSSDATIQIKSTKNGTWTIGESLGSLDFFGSDTSGSGAGVKSSIQSNAGVANGAGFGLDFFTHNTSTLNKRISVDYNGDISFYEDTGTTAKLFWDASAESLGIGTTSVGANALIVEGGTSYFKDHVYIAGGTSKMISSDSSSNPLLFGINTQEKMRIDSSGNVGIGVTPSFNLHVFQSGPLNSVLESDTGNSNLRITSGDGDSAQIFFGDQTNDTISQIKHDNSDNSLAFFTAGSNERMRIDNSGNVGI